MGWTNALIQDRSSPHLGNPNFLLPKRAMSLIKQSRYSTVCGPWAAAVETHMPMQVPACLAQPASEPVHT